MVALIAPHLAISGYGKAKEKSDLCTECPPKWQTVGHFEVYASFLDLDNFYLSSIELRLNSV